MSAVTIPAAMLAALGFVTGDQPVQTSTGIPVGRWQWDVELAKDPRMLLVVEQSMGTLLRALARQYGAKLEPGEVPSWYGGPEGCWWLEWSGGYGHCFSGRGAGSPALTVGMGRLEALAAVIAWRVSR